MLTGVGVGTGIAFCGQQKALYRGISEILSDPTDLLHAWSLRDISRNSGLLGATLRRGDGVEKDFGYTSKGYLDRAAVLAWAGASAVTVVRLWGLGGTQFGPELVTNGNFSAGSSGWTFDAARGTLNTSTGVAVISDNGSNVAFPANIQQSSVVEASKSYQISFTVVAGVFKGFLAGETNTNAYFNLDLGPGNYIYRFLTASPVTGRLNLYCKSNSTVTLDNVSVREILRPNAIQTTVLNQPPLDLTSNPLRIGAAAGTSLVATMPAALTDAQIVALQDHGVTYDRRPIPSVDPYYVQSATGFKERVILSPDVTTTEVRNIMLNIKRAWKNPRAVMDYPVIGEALGGGFYTGAAWDTVTYSPSTLTIGVGTHTLAISGGNSLPLYAGQWVTLAPQNNTTQVFMRGAVASVSNDSITVVVDSITGSGAHTNWVIACPWRVILAPKVGGETTGTVAYKIENTAAPVECKTLTNGRAATAAMIAANVAAGSVVYPAANAVKLMNDVALGGKADWELPARDWLELVWRNLKPVTTDNTVTTARPKNTSYVRDANADDSASDLRAMNRNSIPSFPGNTAATPAQTAVTQFRAGGAQAMAMDAYFWSSSEHSSEFAWFQFYLLYPGFQSATNKAATYKVRAVRREILEAA